MKKSEVEIGRSYVVKVSGNLAPVLLDAVHHAGGWTGTNTKTGRQVRIRTAAKLRFLVLTSAEKAANLASVPLVEGALRGASTLYGRGISGAKRGARLMF